MKDAIQMARVFRHLFDAAADFEKWPHFLENLAGLFSASGANLVYFDYEDNKLAFSMQHGFDHISRPMLERYSELLPEDPRIVFARKHAGMPVTCRQCVDEETLYASRVYKEFLKPTGVEYTLGVHFLEDTTGAALSVMRGPEDSPFTEADCELFGEIIPSVKRAIELHRKLAVLDFEKRTAFDSLNGIPIGLVLVEENGHVCFSNKTANEISDDGDGFSLNNGQFMIQTSEESGKIRDYVGLAVRSARNNKILPAEGLTISRPSGMQSYEVVISTVWGNHVRFGLGHLGDPVAVLFITDPGRPQETPVELLQRLFGLTPAEAKVVELLVAGNSVAEIAENLEISQHTVREHLSVAFEKTGTQRQGQLIKRILSSPVWITAHEQRDRYAEAHASKGLLVGSLN